MKNIHDMFQWWIMTAKDHFSGITYNVSLPLKREKYVVHALIHLFGLIGYPNIFHDTDNGKEFVAKEILELCEEINPNILVPLEDNG